MIRRYLQLMVGALLCLILLIESVLADAGTGYIALIIELKGTVLIKRKNAQKFEQAIWGSYVYEGDQVQTKSKSKVSLLFSNGNMIALNENSSMTLMKQSEHDKLVPKTKESKDAEKMSPEPERLSLDSLTFQKLTIRTTKDGKIQIYPGIRPLILQPTEALLFPRQTNIITQRPIFIWEALDNCQKYKIVLYNDKQRLWSYVINETQLRFPDEKPPLEYNQSYTWTLFKINQFDTIKVAATYFYILSLEENKKVVEIEVKIKQMQNTSEENYCEFLQAVAYEKFGLQYKTMAQFEQLIELNPKSPFPHEARARLYHDIGLYTLAYQEFEKYKALSD